MMLRGSRPVQEGSADYLVRELELGVEPEDVNELLPLHDKTLMDEELLPMDEQRKWFLEMLSTPGENFVKALEMTKMNLDYYMKLIP